jgi:hypothetical protein
MNNPNMTTRCAGCGKPSATAFCDACAPPDPAAYTNLKLRDDTRSTVAERPATEPGIHRGWSRGARRYKNLPE